MGRQLESSRKLYSWLTKLDGRETLNKSKPKPKIYHNQGLCVH